MPITVHTWTGRKLEPARNPGLAEMEAVRMKPAAANTYELTLGTVLGRQTADDLYDVYDNTAADGTEIAAGILAYDISVDTDGNIALTQTAGSAGEFGEKTRDIGMYIRGEFYGADLKQAAPGAIDAGALGDLNAHFLDGDLTDGILIIP